VSNGAAPRPRAAPRAGAVPHLGATAHPGRVARRGGAPRPGAVARGGKHKAPVLPSPVAININVCCTSKKEGVK